MSEVEAVPAPEVVNLTVDDWLSDWPTGEDPVNKDTIEKKLKEVPPKLSTRRSLRRAARKLSKRQLITSLG